MSGDVVLKDDKVQGRWLSGFSYVTMEDWRLLCIQFKRVNLRYFYAYWRTLESNWLIRPDHDPSKIRIFIISVYIDYKTESKLSIQSSFHPTNLHFLNCVRPIY